MEFHQSATEIFKELEPQAQAIADSLFGGACALDCVLEFRNMGRTAGRASRTRTGSAITINPQLADHPGELSPTLAHEWAHIVVESVRKRLGIGLRRGQWAAHGVLWQEVAQRLGGTGTRCHRLPLEPTRRVQARFVYLSTAGTRCTLTAIRHNRIQRKKATYHCAKSGAIGRRQFIGEEAR